MAPDELINPMRPVIHLTRSAKPPEQAAIQMSLVGEGGVSSGWMLCSAELFLGVTEDHCAEAVFQAFGNSKMRAIRNITPNAIAVVRKPAHNRTPQPCSFSRQQKSFVKTSEEFISKRPLHSSEFICHE
jgi:hypothetical protein